MPLYLGIDASTQSVKGLVIAPDSGTIIQTVSVNFGQDLPQYHAPNGFMPNADLLVCQADPLMWVDGLLLMLERLRDAGVNLADIAGVSGSGQQHGSVYLRRPFTSWDLTQPLIEQIRPLLSRAAAPIWLDRSTKKECDELTGQFGDEVYQITGSNASERFTGPQLRKFARNEPAQYQATARVHLVSSFLCSVLIGGDALLDYGDGSGMNLMDLRHGVYAQNLVNFTAPNLSEKLPELAPGTTVAGRLDPYFARFGLRTGIPVVIWSGDNPSSLIGLGATDDTGINISLGTSDTVFAALAQYRLDPERFGHVFGNPAGGFMSLSCFSNGSLAREQVKNDCQVDWDYFDCQALLQTPPGNDGKLLLPYFTAESTPVCLHAGIKANFDWRAAGAATKIRALLESQALTMRLHSQWAVPQPTHLKLTGGAAKSGGFQQILADVFQAPVELTASTNAAALGAAMRAAGVVGKLSLAELSKRFTAPMQTLLPRTQYGSLYEHSLKQYAELEKEYCR